MAKRLSEAQLRILEFSARHQGDRIYCFSGSWHWVGHYETGPRIDKRSVKRLLQEGYIECVGVGLADSKYYNITEAGRQALAEEENR